MSSYSKLHCTCMYMYVYMYMYMYNVHVVHLAGVVQGSCISLSVIKINFCRVWCCALYTLCMYMLLTLKSRSIFVGLLQ